MKSNPQLCHPHVKASSMQLRPLSPRHIWKCSIPQSTVVYFYFSFKMFQHYLNICHLRYEFYCVRCHGSGSCLFHEIYNWNSYLKDYQCCWATIQTSWSTSCSRNTSLLWIPDNPRENSYFLVCYAGNGIQSIMLANQTLYQRTLPLVWHSGIENYIYKI